MSYTAAPPRRYGAGILTYGPLSCVDQRVGSAGSTAWPATNLAIYVPVRVPWPVVIVSLAVCTATTASGNFDIGIYNAAGVRLVSSGSQAHSGANQEEVVDVTDTTLMPGLHYLAACFDNTTAVIYGRTLAAPIPLANGVLTEALGSVVLPATATFAADQTLAYVPNLIAFTSTVAA